MDVSNEEMSFFMSNNSIRGNLNLVFSNLDRYSYYCFGRTFINTIKFFTISVAIISEILYTRPRLRKTYVL